jgi:hypothetical protein
MAALALRGVVALARPDGLERGGRDGGAEERRVGWAYGLGGEVEVRPGSWGFGASGGVSSAPHGALAIAEVDAHARAVDDPERPGDRVLQTKVRFRELLVQRVRTGATTSAATQACGGDYTRCARRGSSPRPRGCLPSTTVTGELVVPRSVPTILPTAAGLLRGASERVVALVRVDDQNLLAVLRARQEREPPRSTRCAIVRTEPAVRPAREWGSWPAFGQRRPIHDHHHFNYHASLTGLVTPTEVGS